MHKLGKLCLLALTLQVNCYANTIKVNKLWNNFTLNNQMEKVGFQLESQFRFRDTYYPFEQNLFIFGANSKISSNTALWLGFTQAFTGRTAVSQSFQERRWWQQIIYSGGKETFNYISRTRLEARNRDDFNTWNYRMRERITINKQLIRTLFLSGYDELFVNINRPQWVVPKLIDQNRLYLGLSQQASKQLNVGAGYLYQLIFSNPRQAANVIQLSAQYNLDN